MSEFELYQYKQSKTTGLWVVYVGDVKLVEFTKEENAKADVVLANECLLPGLDPTTPASVEARLKGKFNLWREVKRIRRERGEEL